jgi:hypothetical protein
VLSNLSEQERVSRDIEETEKVLADALSRLTRLRTQQRSLRDRGAEVFRRGMARLEEEEEPDSPRPMSEEQSLVGQVQSLGAFGVVDWEAVGVPPGDDLSWLNDPLPVVAQGYVFPGPSPGCC